MLEGAIQKSHKSGHSPFILIGTIGAVGIAFALMKCHDMNAKFGKTQTPEWRAATKEYRKFHKMDPISNKYD